jgi:predicted transcriptional regulator
MALAEVRPRLFRPHPCQRFSPIPQLFQTGKAKSNLSRTLKTMAGYGLIRLERGERGRIAPKVIHDRVGLDLPLAGSQKAS